ncbi:uncharacterized protein LOC116060758 [Sander lucioperca]|uniref:uncharacterized protein LOC116060758 n=1 Tax=Sander lucioperca TaxID=283035 RepID=UPI001653E305|nr:uncharacterized protein LOC116060758 [Sander lucioperca]
MKRRCVPLRADHELLLTPDTRHTLSGVLLHPVVQLRSGGVASLLSDSSGRESAVGSSRRRPVASPTRLLRFEDETETEAESRYLERQQQRRRIGVLASKPDLNLYVNGRPGTGLQGPHGHQGTGLQGTHGHQGTGLQGAHGHQGTGLQGAHGHQGTGLQGAHGHQGTGLGRVGHHDQQGMWSHCPQGAGLQGAWSDYPQGAGPSADRQHSRRTARWDSCGTVLGSRVSLKPCLQLPDPEERGRSLYRPCLSLQTEPIRETYIGSVTVCDRSGGGGERRSTNQNMPTTDLPINPYAPQHLATPLSRSSSSPQSVRLNSTKAEQNLNHNQSQSREEQGVSAAEPHRELQSWAEVTERSSVDPKAQSSETTAESQAPPSSGSSDGQVRQPMRAEVYSNYTSHPERVISREEPARLSLRRLFSSVKLSTTRTGSLDRLRSRPRRSESGPAPSESDPAPSEYGPASSRYSSAPPGSDSASSGHKKTSSLLRKTPSVQSLSVGSPFLQLRRSSSVQSFVSEQKKKKKPDRSAAYRPAADHLLQRCLSVEDVGRPSSVRSLGRVLQVSADGSFLLELSRPESRTFGFLISRGRGRPDSGVYVEDMVDSGTKKLYAGLLAVGDEILEVNGEKVVCLSLDQVTQLLTQNPSATVRVLRHRRAPPR